MFGNLVISFSVNSAARGIVCSFARGFVEIANMRSSSSDNKIASVFVLIFHNWQNCFMD